MCGADWLFDVVLSGIGFIVDVSFCLLLGLGNCVGCGFGCGCRSDLFGWLLLLFGMLRVVLDGVLGVLCWLWFYSVCLFVVLCLGCGWLVWSLLYCLVVY